MDQKLPFSNYDFWAYLSSGFLLLFALDQTLATGVFARESWTIVNAVLAFSLAYVVGQLVASASSLLFERGLVGTVLGYPRVVLLSSNGSASACRYMIPEYFKPLPEGVRRAVFAKAKAIGIDDDPTSIYWAAYATARGSTATAARMDSFLNMYGFCRNCAMAGIVSSALLYWSYLQPTGPAQHLLWSRMSLLLGIGMMFRYLKFFRQFCVEVLSAYAFSANKDALK
jgi:hypothetical protein